MCVCVCFCAFFCCLLVFVVYRRETEGGWYFVCVLLVCAQGFIRLQVLIPTEIYPISTGKQGNRGQGTGDRGQGNRETGRDSQRLAFRVCTSTTFVCVPLVLVCAGRDSEWLESQTLRAGKATALLL